MSFGVFMDTELLGRQWISPVTPTDGWKPRSRPAEKKAGDFLQGRMMGRPPRRVGERLRKTRTFRVRDELDFKLKMAAQVSGRSVSEEIEFRLERTFIEDYERALRIAERAWLP
jgi:hypothetical protein